MSRPDVLFPLFADLTGLSGVGPKIARLLAKMEIVHPADLVLTDIVMPRKDGIETIRELRQLNADIRVIAMTGVRDRHNRLVAARSLGAHRTLMKPFGLEELLAAVRATLAG